MVTTDKDRESPRTENNNIAREGDLEKVMAELDLRLNQGAGRVGDRVLSEEELLSSSSSDQQHEGLSPLKRSSCLCPALGINRAFHGGMISMDLQSGDWEMTTQIPVSCLVPGVQQNS